MSQLKTWKDPLDHQHQRVGLHCQKTEENQHMRRADQGLAPDVGLTQYVRKQDFNALADPVELEVRLSLNRLHQPEQMI